MGKDIEKPPLCLVGGGSDWQALRWVENTSAMFATYDPHAEEVNGSIREKCVPPMGKAFGVGCEPVLKRLLGNANLGNQFQGLAHQFRITLKFTRNQDGGFAGVSFYHLHDQLNKINDVGDPVVRISIAQMELTFLDGSENELVAENVDQNQIWLFFGQVQCHVDGRVAHGHVNSTVKRGITFAFYGGRNAENRCSTHCRQFAVQKVIFTQFGFQGGSSKCLQAALIEMSVGNQRKSRNPDHHFRGGKLLTDKIIRIHECIEKGFKLHGGFASIFSDGRDFTLFGKQYILNHVVLKKQPEMIAVQPLGLEVLALMLIGCVNALQGRGMTRLK